MPPNGNYTLPGVLVIAVIALFGLLTRVIALIIQRDNEAIKAADARTVEANAAMLAERARYDKLLERVVTVVERMDENVGALYRILDGHLQYMRKVFDTVAEHLPADPPDAAPPARRRREEGRQ